MKLNLTATNPAEERIKAYLEENASAPLAQKINLGSPHFKDGKPYINRKTLAGFFQYATEEARKLATKGANFACVDDETVFGWSIHYFEEESIIGELFNLDGTPYKAEKKAPTETPKKAPQKPKAEAPKQMSILAEDTAETPKKAVILTPKSSKPTEAYPTLPKPTKKQKPAITDPDQLSFF